MGRTIRDLVIGFNFNVNMAPLKRLDNSIRQIKTNFNQAGRGAAGFQAVLRSVGGAARAAGSELSLKVGAPLMALGGIAAKAAIDFESAFAGVKKTVGGSTQQLAEMEAGIRKMATKLPASAVEISKVAEAAGQLGIKRENILSFSKTMIDMGVSTNMTADEAATSMARFANIMKMPQTAVSNLGSAIVALGNDGASTEKEIMDMGLRIAGAGKVAGMSEAEVLAFANALSSLGMEAEAGGSSMSQVIKSMYVATKMGGKGLQQFATVAGISMDEFKKRFSKDAAGTVDLFATRLGKMHNAGENVVGTLNAMGFDGIRVSDTLLRLSTSGDLLHKSLANGKKAWAENSALTNEANQRYKTLASRLAVTKNKATEAGIVFGTELMPTIEKLATIMGNLATAFAELSPTTKTLIIDLGLIAIAAGPVLWVIGGISSAIGVLAGVIASWPAIAFMAAFFGITAATAGVGLAIGGVIWALSDLYAYLTTGESAMSGFWEPWVSAVDGFRMGMAELGAEIWKTVTDIGTAIANAAANPAAAWDAAWGALATIARGYIDSIMSWIANIPSAIANAAAGLGNLALQAVGLAARTPGADAGARAAGGAGGGGGNRTVNQTGGNVNITTNSPAAAKAAAGKAASFPRLPGARPAF